MSLAVGLVESLAMNLTTNLAEDLADSLIAEHFSNQKEFWPRNLSQTLSKVFLEVFY